MPRGVSLGECRIPSGRRLVIEDGGALVLATGSDFRVDRQYWDDYQVSAISGKLGALDTPDFDYTNIGLAFPQNDTSEIAYITDQMPHRWAGGVIHPHIHWLQTSSDVAGWKMDYRWYNNGGAVPSFTTGVAITEQVFTYATGTITQISKFAAIDLSAYKPSALFDIKIYRDDNVITGDVCFKSFDFHYLVGGVVPFGTRTEYRR